MDMKALRKIASQKAEDMKNESSGDYAPWLTLDEGEEFVGRITVIRDNTFDDSGKTNLYEAVSLDDEDSAFTLPAHAACVSKMAKFKPEVGQVVYIKYLGKVKSTKSKFKYNDYEVAVLTEDEAEELGITSDGPKKPSKKTSTKKPVDDDDDDDEPVKKPAKKATKKPAEDDDEDEEPPAKKPAKKTKQGAFPEMDADEKKSLVAYVKKALEFNDNEIDLKELIRLCKTKGITFDDEEDAKQKILYCGFDVNEDNIVSKA
jgi:hypothetical protein